LHFEEGVEVDCFWMLGGYLHIILRAIWFGSSRVSHVHFLSILVLTHFLRGVGVHISQSDALDAEVD